MIKYIYISPLSKEIEVSVARPIATSGTQVNGQGSVIDDLEVDDWGNLE